jgi:hypothetical protein
MDKTNKHGPKRKTDKIKTRTGNEKKIKKQARNKEKLNFKKKITLCVFILLYHKIRLETLIQLYIANQYLEYSLCP